ncbi:helix-turn-helix domain-containing protein [Paenarthrobacter sp. YAF11_1]|uniref:helix-turn-helix domain-containing protein n=1 Tax=Paenarthrobacter sp. YAF11_1 TaxID=3233074 RepID=UPI003F983CEA
MSGWVGLEQLMTAEEVADVLRAPSTKTVAGLRQKNKLRGVRVGRSYRYHKDDVEELIEKLRAEAKQEQFWANEENKD